MQNFVQKDKKKCCGCGLCINSCPVCAITMVTDDQGVLYPQIDAKKCIKCGKCKNICIFKKGNDSSLNIRYAAKHKDENIIKNSRSGGVFTALCDYILKNDGIICGCTLNDNFEAVHVIVEDRQNLKLINKSKYLQSQIYQLFDEIKKNLKSNKKVLFSGTPCQIAAINEFIPSTLRHNLYLVEIVCHGVPGSRIFNDYMRYIEKKENGKITKVEFRNKDIFGWHNSGESFYINNKWIHTEDYMTVYNSDMILRESCYNCVFKDSNTQKSDITIGDMWGVEKAAPQFNDNKGTSIIIINTIKGKEIFNEIKKDIKYSSVEDRYSNQQALVTPTKKPIFTWLFWRLYKLNSNITIKLAVVYVKICYRLARLKKEKK